MKREMTLLAATALAATGLWLSGCSDDSPAASATANDNGTSTLVPTYTEVSRAVTLDDADAAVVKAALGEWREAERSGDGRANGFAGRHRMMEFVAAVAPSLDDAQLGNLVDLLVARVETRREEMRNQHRGQRGERRGDLMAGMAGELGLSREQIAAMQQLHDQTRAREREQFQALKAGTITREQLREQLRAIREEHREKMAGILTAEQLAKLETLRDQRQDRRIDRQLDRLGDNADHHVAWLDAVLDLSDAQVAQVREAFTTFVAARQASLEALKADTITRDQHHDQMTAAHDAFETALDGILTAEQRARLEIVSPLFPRGPRAA